jgi:hypothetical protein
VPARPIGRRAGRPGNAEAVNLGWTDVLVHSGLDLGLPSLVGNKPAYVIATRSYLVGEQEIAFSPKEIVVEVCWKTSHAPPRSSPGAASSL